MRMFMLACCVPACCVFALSAPLVAQTPPGPSDATPNDRDSATATARATADSTADAAPTDPRALRNWLLARLIVDRHLNGEQAQALEQKLANITDNQLDVVSRVYQQKHSEQEAAAAAELSAAQENLEQLKQYRDAAADELTSWRTYRQAQYLNFGYRPGGYAYAGSPNLFGNGAYGYGGGYGGGGYGGAGFGGGGYGGYGLGAGFGGIGLGVSAYGAYPYGAGLGVYAAPYLAQPYYSGYPGMGYGASYPMYGATGVGLGVGIY